MSPQSFSPASYKGVIVLPPCLLVLSQLLSLCLPRLCWVLPTTPAGTRAACVCSVRLRYRALWARHQWSAVPVGQLEAWRDSLSRPCSEAVCMSEEGRAALVPLCVPAGLAAARCTHHPVSERGHGARACHAL